MAGMSLVELMIALTLGLLLVAAVGWVYFGTVRTYRAHDALSRMQEGARYAFEQIGKDVRMTGVAGCPFSTRENVVATNTDWYKNLFEQPLIAVEEDGLPGETEFSDALRVLRADVSREYVVQNHNEPGALFTLTAAHNIDSGDLMVATDCDHAVVFQTPAAAGTTVSHALGGVPGNTVAALGGGGAARTYPPGSRLYRLSAATYYVDENPVGEPSLFRVRPMGATATPTAEELIEGIEDLQVSFGVDTDAVPDGQANFVDPDADGDPYLRSDQVDTATVPGATTAERWSRVVSVRISLLLRSTDDRVVPTEQTFVYNGAPVAAADKRLRKIFTHVIKLRNR
jgi:type IV pilus assembly protein PilW